MKSLRGLWAPNVRDARRSGQALVEFALAAPLLVFLLLGIITYGLYINANITVEQAARVGARAALIGYPIGCPGDAADSPTVYGQVDAQINQGFGLSDLNSAGTPRNLLDPAPTTVTGANQDITVTIKYLYHPIIPLPGLLPSALTLQQADTVLSQAAYPPSQASCTTTGASQEIGGEPASDPASDSP